MSNDQLIRIVENGMYKIPDDRNHGTYDDVIYKELKKLRTKTNKSLFSINPKCVK